MTESIKELKNRLKQDNSAANAKMALFEKKVNGHLTEITSLSEVLHDCKKKMLTKSEAKDGD